MRIENAIKNSTISFFMSIIKLIVSFFLRRTFLIILGEKYLGLNGLLVNIISMFSLVDLGIGSAIGYSLYKPLLNKDVKDISSKMNFFKIVYRYIAIIILILGFLFYPFLEKIINKNGDFKISLIQITYLLFVFDTSISYLLSYKKILLEADQKNYKVNLINTIFFLIVSVIQYVVLIKYNSFILYIIAKIIMNILNNYFCFILVNKNYKYLKKYKFEKIKINEKAEIIKNTKALILHKIGDICINSTDNLIIANYINIVTVGLFSNYTMIISAVQGIIIQIFSSLTSSIGNLIVGGNRKKSSEIFYVLNYIGFIIFGLVTVNFYISIELFIKIWVGEKYVIDGIFLIIITLNMYITGMRVVTGTVKMAAGFYTQDKYSPLIQSIFNLVFSIFFVKKYGLVGVLLGTLISSLVPTLYRPYVIYKYLLKEKVHKYFIVYIKYLSVVYISILLSLYIISNIKIQNNLLNLIANVIISSSIFLIIAIAIVIKSEEINYIKKNIIKRLGVNL